jgi:hypothetical protein
LWSPYTEEGESGGPPTEKFQKFYLVKGDFRAILKPIFAKKKREYS